MNVEAPGGGPPNAGGGDGVPVGAGNVAQDGDGGQAPAAPVYQVRYMDGAPGPFSPSGAESARSYLRRFKRYCEIQNILNNVQECVRRLGIFLRDSAQVWLDNRQFANFADLEAQFLQDFGDLHSRRALLAALDKKKLIKGVALSTYLAEIRDLVQRLDLPEASISDAFFRGLPPKLQSALNLGQFENFCQLYNKAQEHLENLNPFDEDSRLGFPMTLTMADMHARLDRMAARLSLMDSQLQALGNNGKQWARP